MRYVSLMFRSQRGASQTGLIMSGRSKGMVPVTKKISANPSFGIERLD